MSFEDTAKRAELAQENNSVSKIDHDGDAAFHMKGETKTEWLTLVIHDPSGLPNGVR